MVFDTSWLVLAAVCVISVGGEAQTERSHFGGININDALEQHDKKGFEALELCDCLSTSDCRSRRHTLEKTCGEGKCLCRHKPFNKERKTLRDLYNDIGEEPQMLYPGRERLGGPFPPPDSEPKESSLLVGPVGPAGYIGPGFGRPTVGPGVLTGLNGPKKYFESTPNMAASSSLKPTSIRPKMGRIITTKNVNEFFRNSAASGNNYRRASHQSLNHSAFSYSATTFATTNHAATDRAATDHSSRMHLVTPHTVSPRPPLWIAKSTVHSPKLSMFATTRNSSTQGLEYAVRNPKYQISKRSFLNHKPTFLTTQNNTSVVHNSKPPHSEPTRTNQSKPENGNILQERQLKVKRAAEFKKKRKFRAKSIVEPSNKPALRRRKHGQRQRRSDPTTTKKPTTHNCIRTVATVRLRTMPTSTTTTVKPSIFRKIPIFLAALTVIKAFIVFGLI